MYRPLGFLCGSSERWNALTQWIISRIEYSVSLLIHCVHYALTSWIRVRFLLLVVAQLLKKFPRLLQNLKVRYWFHKSPIVDPDLIHMDQFHISHPRHLRSILILSHIVHPGLRGMFSLLQVFRLKFCVLFLICPMCYKFTQVSLFLEQVSVAVTLWICVLEASNSNLLSGYRLSYNRGLLIFLTFSLLMPGECVQIGLGRLFSYICSRFMIIFPSRWKP